jgi:uncharacterized protein YrrD
MSVLMRSGEIRGRPVVTRDTAEDVAEVKDVVLSYATAGLVGFTLNRRGFLGSPLEEVLPWSGVASLGRDAVMIASSAALVTGDAAMTAVYEGREPDVIGVTVMTEDGTRVGVVTDVILEIGQTADVIGFEMDGPDARLLLPIDDTIAVSGDTLMVPTAARDFVRDDLSGFGSAVADFRARLRSPA